MNNQTMVSKSPPARSRGLSPQQVVKKRDNSNDVEDWKTHREALEREADDSKVQKKKMNSLLEKHRETLKKIALEKKQKDEEQKTSEERKKQRLDKVRKAAGIDKVKSRFTEGRVGMNMGEAQPKQRAPSTPPKPQKPIEEEAPKTKPKISNLLQKHKETLQKIAQEQKEKAEQAKIEEEKKKKKIERARKAAGIEMVKTQLASGTHCQWQGKTKVDKFIAQVNKNRPHSGQSGSTPRFSSNSKNAPLQRPRPENAHLAPLRRVSTKPLPEIDESYASNIPRPRVVRSQSVIREVSTPVAEQPKPRAQSQAPTPIKRDKSPVVAKRDKSPIKEKDTSKWQVVKNSFQKARECPKEKSNSVVLDRIAGADKKDIRVYKDFDEWKKAKGIETQTKVFSVASGFPSLKKGLLSRGWVENPDESSPFWDLKYSTMKKHIGDFNKLNSDQACNYFNRSAEIVTKIGLMNNLRNASTITNPTMDVDDFFPSTYDLTSNLEVNLFANHFKFNQVLCVLKRVASGSKFPEPIIDLCVHILKRHTQPVDEKLDSNHDHEDSIVTDEEWEILRLVDVRRPNKHMPAYSTKGERPKRKKDDPFIPVERQWNQNKDFAPKQKMVSELLSTFEPTHPQYFMEGDKNVWILKPAGMSRGRGIFLADHLDHILDFVKTGQTQWIIQKYLENPQIVEGKKFDIRQWVLVTSFSPLAVWFYDNSYLRFSWEDYDVKTLGDRMKHLTNYSVIKHADEFEENRDDTMWHCDRYAEYLNDLDEDGENNEDEEDIDRWENIQNQMKKIVYSTMQCVSDKVEGRNMSFEFYGFDFMVDEKQKVWLLEVNSSPDLSYSTSTTKELVKEVLTDLVKVVVDVEGFGTKRKKRSWGKKKHKSGAFEYVSSFVLFFQKVQILRVSTDAIWTSKIASVETRRICTF